MSVTLLSAFYLSLDYLVKFYLLSILEPSGALPPVSVPVLASVLLDSDMQFTLEMLNSIPLSQGAELGQTLARRCLVLLRVIKQ